MIFMFVDVILYVIYVILYLDETIFYIGLIALIIFVEISVCINIRMFRSMNINFLKYLAL